MAGCDGATVGALAVVEEPGPLRPGGGRPRRYVDLLLRGGDRRAALLEHAVAFARDTGVGLLRVDCWAGSPGTDRVLRRTGFHARRTYTVNDQYGQIFRCASAARRGAAAR